MRLFDDELGLRYGNVSKHVTHEDDTHDIVALRAKAAMKKAISIAPSTVSAKTIFNNVSFISSYVQSCKLTLFLQVYELEKRECYHVFIPFCQTRLQVHLVDC